MLDALRAVASEVGRPPAQVALAWAMGRPGVTSLLLGASRPEQVHDNLASLDLTLTPDQRRTLDDVSRPEAPQLYSIFSGGMNRAVFGGATVQGWE